MLLAALAASGVTAGVIFGVQAWWPKAFSLADGGDAARRLAGALLGKWELAESNSDAPPPPKDAGPPWIEFRKDGTLRHRSFTTVTNDGNVVSQEERVQLAAYTVPDGEHIVVGEGGEENHIRVVLDGDELTLHNQYGGVERYRRAK
jgi:hypothetical protein